MKRAIRTTLAVVVLSAVGAASALAGVPTAAQRLCIARLNEAGAGVADAGGKNVVRCIRDAGRARLPVNDAFARPLRLDTVFGASIDAAIILARHDRAGAACQTMVARGLTTIAIARLREFNACKAAGLKAGTTGSTTASSTAWPSGRATSAPP